MERLVAFGCSITYGHALPDCHVPPCFPGPVPSKQAWPSLVATYFNVPLSNQGVCGNSNLAILNDILKFKFLKGDVAIIMWSFTDRDLLFGKKNFLGKQELIPIGRWQNTELSEHWIATHPETDLATRSWFYMHHATLYLKSIGIPLYNVFSGYKELKKYKPNYIKLDFYKTKTQGMFPIDRGLDNLHPGPITHSLIAEEIIKILHEN
jgi:hypothetical protein